MGTFPTEQARRREAIRRRLAGERRCAICHDVDRSPRWVDKWWHAYQANPDTALADQSRAPQPSPTRLAVALKRAMVSVRRAREAGCTAETRYGFIGARAVQSDLKRRGLERLPSVASIGRVLAKHGLTDPRGAAEDTTYAP